MCCTASLLASPKWRSSAFVTRPLVGAERLVDLPVQVDDDLAGALDELLVEVACRALELGLDEVGVRAGVLAIEHTGADLEGVAHELGRIVAGVDALGDEPDDALVLDGEAVDAQPVAEDVDVRERQWGRGFHGETSHGRARV